MGETMTNTDIDFCVPTRDSVRGYEMKMLSAEALEHHWKSIEHMMGQVPHTLRDWTPNSLHRQALKGSAQVWAVSDGAKIMMVLITQIAVFPRGRVLELFWGAGQGIVGEAHELIDATLEMFATSEHCHRIDVIGRDGWQKYAKQHNFTRAATTWSRPVIHRGMQ